MKLRILRIEIPAEKNTCHPFKFAIPLNVRNGKRFDFFTILLFNFFPQEYLNSTIIVMWIKRFLCY